MRRLIDTSPLRRFVCNLRWSARTLVLKPTEQLVELSGTERDDDVYGMIREGNGATYVTSKRHIAVVHRVYFGLSSIVDAHNSTAVTFNDVVLQQREKGNVLQRVLIRREFWDHDDFNSPESNQSFGIQNRFFDNFHWSSSLWKDFRVYVERWYPLAEHTHLTYFEYIQLVRYFYLSRRGVSCAPLVRKGIRIWPQYGVPVLPGPMRTPLILFRTWMQSFVPSLGIKKALVVRAGCGLLPIMMRRQLKLIRTTDPNPVAVAGLRENIKRLGGEFTHMRCEVSDMFPRDDHVHEQTGSLLSSSPPKLKYDLVVFSPDVPFLNVNDGWYDNRFAPTQKGVQGDLEMFFERAGAHLSPHGVIAVVTTNIYSIAFPDAPNPIELEIKANRRWLLLDYFDAPMEGTFAQDPSLAWNAGSSTLFRTSNLRAEVWILHRVEDLHTFGWLHGLPGCAPPSNVVGQWKGTSLQSNRLKGIKKRVVEMGGDWGTYRDRLLNMLREQSTRGDEDEVAQAVRMSLDPSYADELAENARRAVLANLERQNTFHRRVWEESEKTKLSPRQQFDVENQRAMHGATTPPTTAVNLQPHPKRLRKIST